MSAGISRNPRRLWLLPAMAAMVCLLVVGAAAVDVPSCHDHEGGHDPPRVLWAQRESLLYVRVLLPDLDRESAKVSHNDTHLFVSANAADLGTSKTKNESEPTPSSTLSFFCLSLEFFRRVESNVTTTGTKANEILLTVTKKWHWMYWPRLLRDPFDPLKSKVGIDWKRWKAEDEDGLQGIDALHPDLSDWLDDDLAVTKVASFPEEEYDEGSVPLLDGATLATYLERANLTLVHFFERSENCRKCRQLARLLAHVADQINQGSGQLSVGRVDAVSSFDLTKKLHVTTFPQLKLFFRSGDVLTVDSNAIRNSKQLQYYLIDQLQPAWIELDPGNATALEMVLEKRERVAVFVRPEGGTKRARAAERAFDAAAKKFRAMVVRQTNLVFLKTSEKTLLAALERSKTTEAGENLSSLAPFFQDKEEDGEEEESGSGGDGDDGKRAGADFNGGLFVVKKGEEPWRYTMSTKWKAKSVFNWIRRAQFKLVEQVTPSNFPEFRRRGNPMLYILLAGNDTDAHEEILEFVRPLAKSAQNKVTFVYTLVAGAEVGDLLGHLRCDFDGETSFAVLEDFAEEYRYCVEASVARPLTPGRIQRLVDGFISQDRTVVHSPDKLRSQPIPKENLGPVFDVVGENLMRVVLDPKKDVVIHFYSPMDDKWDYDETELNKAAEALEEAESVLIGRIDGFENEKPREFPDIGYFPCTYIFPMANKMMPIAFNKTEGFLKHRLLEWIGKHASKPEDLPREAFSGSEQSSEQALGGDKDEL